MDVKFGKIVSLGTSNNSQYLKPLEKHDGNFFANSDSKQNNNQESPIIGNRINDFDSNILENNAYQSISDEMFKIEHKIGILENTLSKIISEIDAMQSLGYSMQISEMVERKEKIEKEITELNKKYSELGLSAKISGQIASAINFTSKNKYTFAKFKTFVSKNILAKLSKKIDCSQNLKEALEKLSNINLSVDELIKMQVPYGETPKRYEKLTAYLNKANVIHSQISKNMDAITKNNLPKNTQTKGLA